CAPPAPARRSCRSCRRTTCVPARSTRWSTNGCRARSTPWECRIRRPTVTATVASDPERASAARGFEDRSRSGPVAWAGDRFAAHVTVRYLYETLRMVRIELNLFSLLFALLVMLLSAWGL